MINVTLRQMRYVDALARHGHFGRAADACAVSQPALSVQVRAVEQVLGTALFERSARQVRLTAFGEEALVRMRAVLRAVDELETLARGATGGLPQRLRLGVIPTIAPYLLPNILRAMSVDHPEIELQVRESITPRLIDELSEGRIDCALVALPVSEPSFEEMPLFDEPLMLVRSAEDREKPVQPPDAMSDKRLLLLEEGHCFRDQALSLCALQGARARTSMDGSSLATLVQMVAAGLGTTLVPAMAVRVEARAPEVDVRAFPGKQPTRTVGLIWRSTNPLGPSFARLGNLIRAAACDIPDARMLPV
ncbi:hydrogen peroxide-inducible genes activator [Cognatishimia sp. F0-27]|uniref:hydrogen peroxide-inducible genes activator n=1 Tax=Cognatishimia sp. F0-27 TaxID=2816855 RepID=UPI001D0BFF1E|nr:hydrogen peroxide-inducible genes activator [Cognatishimia sp. F0-27]MCC1493116.1 hydrogen peroxide-inducible genes activator [Cognatishimia sp. F0-27]